MNVNELRSHLEALPYPKLGRTLKELKLLGEVSIENSTANIELNSASDTSFETLKKAITQAVDKEFKTINIYPKKQVKKEFNYGHSAKPNNRAPYAKNVIAVTSGKGGVGKTTVAVNIAIALAQEGYSVGILDADVYGPNVPRLMNVDLERITWSDDNKIIPSLNFGVNIMSVALTTPSNDTPLVWRSSVAVSALIQFLEDVAWGELDFLVIDMPPGTGDIQLTMAQELPISASILVSTPQQVSSDDVSRAVMMFKDIDVPIAGVVENMSYFIAPDTQKRYNIFGEGATQRLSEKYNIALLGQIPLEMDIAEASDRGRPPVVFDEKAKKYYKEIVKNLQKEITFR